MSRCTVADCGRPVLARGWCRMHYQRWQRHGTPTAPGRGELLAVAERFWSKVEKTDTCWLWTGHRDRHGYGWLGQRRAYR